MAKKSKKGKKKSKSRFQYRRRTKEEVQKRQNAGSRYDQAFKSQYKVFQAKEGTNRLRILPPTWDDAEHYGLDVWMHSNIGPDSQTYLSRKMLGEPDPIEEAIMEARNDGDGEEDWVKKIRAYRRVLVWVIDRDDEDAGPLLYQMPATLDIEICSQSEDPDTGEILNIDCPDEGYDIVFKRTGKRLNTRYTGVQISRRSTPLSRDSDKAEEWLDFILANPLPDTLNFFSYEHIMETFNGSSPSSSTIKKKGKGEEDDPPFKEEEGEEEEDEEEDEEEEEEEEEDEDDDEEEDEGEDDEEEEEEEEDEGDDDEEEEEEEKPKPSKKKRKRAGAGSSLRKKLGRTIKGKPK